MKTKSNNMRVAGSAALAMNRSEVIRGLMRKLEWDSHPRLKMSLFIIITGASGMLMSYMLLLSGVDPMFVRYPLAVACAYLVFILLLWLWLRTSADDYLDPSIDIPTPSGGSGGGSPDADGSCDFSGGGGQFGGGGASDSFMADDTLPSPSLPDVDIPFGDSVGDAIGGADEGAIPLLVALLVAAFSAALLFASLYIVYLAPALFAELLVDGVLSASLYRRMRGLQTRHWVESAVRRTAGPFIVTAITLSAIGYAFQHYAPQAHTLGDVMQHYHAERQH
ncbi:MAG TPA: hypothetical protein VIU93_02710 [Gallionellaceae bacterium]